MDRVSTSTRSSNDSDRSRTTGPGPDAPGTEQLAWAIPTRWAVVALWVQLVAIVLADAMGMLVGALVGFLAVTAAVVTGYQTAIGLTALDDVDASQAVAVPSEVEVRNNGHDAGSVEAISRLLAVMLTCVVMVVVYSEMMEYATQIGPQEINEVGGPVVPVPPGEYTLLLVAIPGAVIAFGKIRLFLSEHRVYPYSTVGVRHRVEVKDSSVDYCTSCGPRECGDGSNPQFGRLVEFDNGERRQFYRDTVVFGVLVRRRDDGENTYCRPCAEDPIAAELRAERFDDLPEPSISVDDLDEATEAEA